MDLVYSNDGCNPSEAMKNCAALAKREFYDGNLECSDGDLIGVRFDKALYHPISIMRISTVSELSYHRAYQHIRKNRVGLRVIWFVTRGSVKIARAQGQCEIKAGQSGILDSNQPFHATLCRDGEASHESFQVIVPPDLFYAHLQEAEKFYEPFHLDSADGKVVRQLLDLLAENGHELSQRATKPLVQSMLEAIADHLRNCHIDMPKRQKLVDRRLSDIENYIMMNITDPDLCFDKVAANCGISPRYLCYILKANNTSFSELLWQNRLPKARDWLVAARTREYPIHEIAYMSGFKSAAHFSRMFKAAYGLPPREFRALHLAEPSLSAGEKGMPVSWNLNQRESAGQAMMA